jgi:hypothetical protein
MNLIELAALTFAIVVGVLAMFQSLPRVAQIIWPFLTAVWVILARVHRKAAR